MPIEDLIADMKRVRLLSGLVTRNYYRAHGKYKEAEWQKYFPTFANFLDAASEPEPYIGHKPYEFVNNAYYYYDYITESSLGLQTEINSLLNLSNSKAGDFFAMGAKLYQVTGRKDTAVYVKRYYWFNRLYDLARSTFAQSHQDGT